MAREAGPRPRVVAIIQARMGSTRLPGKVLRAVAGKPLLWHVVHRLKRCRTLDEIVIATSIHTRDNAIEAFAHEYGVRVVRGSEDDVLARYAAAAEAAQAGIVVRVTSDAPFLDAAFIDHLVETLIAAGGDYVMLPPGSICAHEGVDPFSRRALDKLMREAHDDRVAREHVSGYFKLHPEFVRIVYAQPDERFTHADTRLSIDTPDDLAFAEMAHERLRAKAGEASLSDLLLLLEREPALKSMNAHVRQKAPEQQGALALIRCDGGSALGYGHVKRSLALGRALRDREGVGVLYALHGDEEAAQPLRRARFETLVLPPFRHGAALAALVSERKPDMLVCDARENLTQAALARLAARVGVTAVIDDASGRRLVATHAYYPPVPQALALPWQSTRCQPRIGWEWAVLGLDPAQTGSPAGERDPLKPRIVVSMGGADPFDFTRLAARALCQISAPFCARFVIGPGFRGAEALCRELEALNPKFEIVRGVENPGPEFAAADLALVAFGVTAYELASLGVPALYLALSEDHALSASAFENAGMGALLGLGRALKADDIARGVWSLLAGGERRRGMRAAGLATIDGRGALRIAADLAGALSETRSLSRAAAR